MTYILSLATASPEYCFEQEHIAKLMIEGLHLSFDKQKKIKKLYENSAIQTRYSVMKDLGYRWPRTIPISWCGILSWGRLLRAGVRCEQREKFRNTGQLER